MTTHVSAVEIFDQLKQILSLYWLNQCANSDDACISASELRNNISPVGHFNPIRPHRIPVFGSSEYAYLKSLSQQQAAKTYASVIKHKPVAVILSDKVTLQQSMLDRLSRSSINIIKAQSNSTKVIEQIQFLINRIFSERCALHGVFLEVFGVGLLITGDSGIGKSELALDLITRGHRLIADDAPEFLRTYPNMLIGSCPESIHRFLEVRGLGILNIQAMFGDSAITDKKQLSLIIHLQQLDGPINLGDRLAGTRKVRSILGMGIPQVSLPVAPGRNLAVLVEVAVRDYLLRAKGYKADEALASQQMKAIESGNQ